MKAITREDYAALLKSSRIKPRLVRDLRFVPEQIDDWANRDYVAVTTKSGNEGIMLVELDQLYVLPFEFSRRITDNKTGRAKPITCDICYTWQQGQKAAQISFIDPKGDRTHTFLCCSDLGCNAHVRGLTPEAALSRSQLHEDLGASDRITRLRRKLEEVVNILQG